MAQLDVYENLDEDSSKEVPFLLDIQHALHHNLQTRIIVPLVRAEAQKGGLGALCLKFVIEGQSVFASVPEMSSYPDNKLGSKIYNLEGSRSEIFSAVDFLFNGF